MAQFLIADYRLEWNLKENKGSVWVKPENKKAFTKIPMTSNTEMLVVLSMLDGPKPIFIDTKKKVFGTVPDTNDIPIS